MSCVAHTPFIQTFRTHVLCFIVTLTYLKDTHTWHTGNTYTHHSTCHVLHTHISYKKIARMFYSDSHIFERQTYVTYRYGVATISRLLKMIGLFCKRALEKRRYSAKETYNLKEPTNRSHPIIHIDITAHVMYAHTRFTHVIHAHILWWLTCIHE